MMFRPTFQWMYISAVDKHVFVSYFDLKQVHELHVQNKKIEHIEEVSTDSLV